MVHLLFDCVISFLYLDLGFSCYLTLFVAFVYIYTLLHELACNIMSNCMSGHGNCFHKLKASENAAHNASTIIAICMLAHVINVYNYP